MQTERHGKLPAGHWSLDDIPWDKFDPAKVNPETLPIVKAAAMVESNGRHYAEYLCNVFSDDPEFQQVALDWAEEEVQHGVALGKWEIGRASCRERVCQYV